MRGICEAEGCVRWIGNDGGMGTSGTDEPGRGILDFAAPGELPFTTILGNDEGEGARAGEMSARGGDIAVLVRCGEISEGGWGGDDNECELDEEDIVREWAGDLCFAEVDSCDSFDAPPEDPFSLRSKS